MCGGFKGVGLGERVVLACPLLLTSASPSGWSVTLFAKAKWWGREDNARTLDS